MLNSISTLLPLEQENLNKWVAFHNDEIAEGGVAVAFSSGSGIGVQATLILTRNNGMLPVQYDITDYGSW